MQTVIALLGALTAFLAVILTYFATVQKRKVDELAERSRKCDAELQAVKTFFQQENAKLQERVDDLLVALATGKQRRARQQQQQ